MRVLAIHAFSYKIDEFNNVSSITWTDGSITIVGTKVGELNSGTYVFANSLYLVRIINN